MNTPVTGLLYVVGLSCLGLIQCSADSAEPRGPASGGGTGGPGSGGNSNPGFGGGTGVSGGTGFGGSTGSGIGGSSMTCPTPPLRAAAGLIDDLDDGENAIKDPPFRGYWYSYNDKSAGSMQTPSADPLIPWAPMKSDSGSPYAACTKGSGFAVWGGGIGFNLVDLGGGKVCAVDGTGVTGVRFKAKGSGTGKIRLQVSRVTTASPANGGTCTAATGCDYHANAPLTALTASFSEFSIPFATLDKGGAASWSANDILGIQFQAYEPTPVSFDFCVDDVAFY